MSVKKKPGMSAKKFAVLGASIILSIYGAQAVTVASYNHLAKHKHDTEMISVYNDIWKNINNQDVNDKIVLYKELANNIPTELKIGVVLPEKTKDPVEISTGLPSAENVENAAKELNKKTTLSVKR